MVTFETQTHGDRVKYFAICICFLISRTPSSLFNPIYYIFTQGDLYFNPSLKSVLLQVENEDEDGKTSPSLHRRNFLKFSIQNILSASARERQDDLEEEADDDEDDKDNVRDTGVNIVRPLVTNWYEEIQSYWILLN